MSFALVGQVVGGSLFGPWGALAGGFLGGAIDRSMGPSGPGPGDLSAPGIALGTRLPRVYGTVRVPVHPISISDFRATESGGGGKGGPSGPTSYTYSLDMLGAICDGTNVIAVTRAWKNKKLEMNFNGFGGELTVAAIFAYMRNNPWGSFLLQTGGPSQMPAPVYEDRVTTADALAYRGMCTVELVDVQCGGSKTPPAIEVEVITQGTPAGVGIPETHTFPLASYVGIDNDEYSSDDYGRFAGDWSLVVQNVEIVSAPVPATDCSVVDWRTKLDATNVTQRFVNLAFRRTPSGGPYRWIVQIDGSSFISDAGTAAEGLTGNKIELRYTSDDDSTRVYIEDYLVHTFAGVGGGSTLDPALHSSYVSLGAYTGGWSVAFNAPVTLTVNSAETTAWTPLPEYLDDVILAELALDPTFDPADVDVTDLSTVEVTGYVAAGPASDTIRELCDIFYVDVVPGNPIKFVRKGAAVVDTVPYADTGAAVDGPGESFTGLTRENADETPAIAAIRFPLLERDHEAGYERGDRLNAETDDVRRIETRVVMTAAQAKGRAIAATLLDRVRRHKTSFALSDAYAALEPGDCVTATDNDGNTARLNARRMAYADGVRSIDWELDDTTALVQTGLTSSEYTPSYTVTPAADVTLYLLDIPILRDADNSYGIYACCTATGDWQGASIYKSSDDVTFTQVGDVANRATVGVATALADFTGWTWDMTSTLTVTLDEGAGGTLSSSTKAAIEADATINVALVGAHGRWEVIRFVTATLTTGTTYTLSTFLRGQLGTEAQNSTHQTGDTFILLQTAGMLRITGTLGDLGVARYYKAVPPGRSVVSQTSQSLTTAEVGLTPYAPTDLRIEGADLVWNRRTRLESRFLLGVDPPLGEASESYDAEIYNGVTLLDSGTVSTSTFVSGDVAVGRIARVYQRSASIGRGQEAEQTL